MQWCHSIYILKIDAGSLRDQCGDYSEVAKRRSQMHHSLSLVVAELPIWHFPFISCGQLDAAKRYLFVIGEAVATVGRGSTAWVVIVADNSPSDVSRVL
jgi:hypothetical protein